mgnify:CR=1 FL=1
MNYKNKYFSITIGKLLEWGSRTDVGGHTEYGISLVIGNINRKRAFYFSTLRYIKKDKSDK